MSGLRVRVVLGLAVALLPARASAEGLLELALAWVQGDYRAPLVCELDGTAREALRRIRIQPGPRTDARSPLRLTFHDLEAPAGIRCSSVSGEPEPNLIGVLELAFDGRSRPDTGEVDFRNAMRHDGGFPFRVTAGRLRIGTAGAPTGELETLDFAGGTAEIRAVVAGSDAARRLAAYGSERQRELIVRAASGRQLRFDLVELPPH